MICTAMYRNLCGPRRFSGELSLAGTECHSRRKLQLCGASTLAYLLLTFGKHDTHVETLRTSKSIDTSVDAAASKTPLRPGVPSPPQESRHECRDGRQECLRHVGEAEFSYTSVGPPRP